jgi:hypothetical protein
VAPSLSQAISAGAILMKHLKHCFKTSKHIWREQGRDKKLLLSLRQWEMDQSC